MSRALPPQEDSLLVTLARVGQHRSVTWRILGAQEALEIRGSVPMEAQQETTTSDEGGKEPQEHLGSWMRSDSVGWLAGCQVVQF